MAEPTFGYGFLSPNDRLGKFNPIAFIISQMLARVRTVTLGKVMGVANTGLDVPAGTVDVQPLVSMVDGNGNATPHGTVFKLPYFRLQSGTSAIILDPSVGDIGIMLICDRDISAVKSSQRASVPPSGREFDFSDGLFIGGVLGTTTPTQFIQFTPTGIVVSDALNVTGTITIDYNGADPATVKKIYTGSTVLTASITVVPNIHVQANSKIFLVATANDPNRSFVWISALVPGISFSIGANPAGSGELYDYMIVNEP